VPQAERDRWDRHRRRIFLICAVGYVLLPVTIERPAIDPAAGWTAMMLRALYRLDPPMNLFPSFHAAAAAVILRLRHGFGRLQTPLVGWMTGICLSCVLAKQHYVMGVIVGLAVGSLSYELVSMAAKARQAHSDRAVSGAPLL
jgi:membrane-associated phospholipid phosphatase